MGELIKTSDSYGIKNKLTTNGSLLTTKKIGQIKNGLAKITLSIDSVDDGINELLGRTGNHKQNILNSIDLVRENDIEVSINSVITRLNLDKIGDVGHSLQEKGVTKWKLLQFTPVRGLAVENQHLYEVSYAQFMRIVSDMRAQFPRMEIIDNSSEYLIGDYRLISPNGYLYNMSSPDDRTSLLELE